MFHKFHFGFAMILHVIICIQAHQLTSLNLIYEPSTSHTGCSLWSRSSIQVLCFKLATHDCSHCRSLTQNTILRTLKTQLSHTCSLASRKACKFQCPSLHQHHLVPSCLDGKHFLMHPKHNPNNGASKTQSNCTVLLARVNVVFDKVDFTVLSPSQGKSGQHLISTSEHLKIAIPTEEQPFRSIRDDTPTLCRGNEQSPSVHQTGRHLPCPQSSK